MTWVAACLGAAGRRPPASSPFPPRSAALCIFCMLPAGSVRSRAKRGGERPRRFGQLFDDRLHLAAQRIRAEPERADHARHHDDRADDARDPDPLEIHYQRIQRVGDEDAEQQRYEERLRQLERGDRSDQGEYGERDMPRAVPGEVDGLRSFPRGHRSMRRGHHCHEPRIGGRRSHHSAKMAVVLTRSAGSDRSSRCFRRNSYLEE